MRETQSDMMATENASRRRLLLAAASAPLIATVPNGAAWSTSIYQCVVTSSDNSGAAPLTPTAVTPPDGWVRASALFARFQTSMPGQPRVLPLWSLDGGATWYNATGVAVPATAAPGCDPTSQYCPQFPPINVNVLASFKATPDAANATDVTLTGFYPLEKPAAQGGDSGNIALYTSCLCSVSPDLLGGACGP